MLDSSQLKVVLSPSEKALAFRKRNVEIARSHIVRVQLTDDAWTWLRGVPSPGLYVPGVAAMGSWRSAGGIDLVLVRRRRPSVVIDLEGDPQFERLVVTTRHGLALVQALRLDVAGEPADVADLAGDPERRP